MADGKKLQQSLEGSSVHDNPKAEIKDYFAASPLRSPERPNPPTVLRWKDILTKEELTQQCPHCKEIGHGPVHCPYPFLFMNVLEDGSLEVRPPKGNRCSRCGCRGHNSSSCHGPVFYKI